jgi:CRISPR/Cas system-associated endonuclease Cas1
LRSRGPRSWSTEGTAQRDALRVGDRWLVAKDVIHLFDPNETPLAQYWGQPNTKEIDRVLAKSKILNPRLLALVRKFTRTETSEMVRLQRNYENEVE